MEHLQKKFYEFLEIYTDILPQHYGAMYYFCMYETEAIPKRIANYLYARTNKPIPKKDIVAFFVN